MRKQDWEKPLTGFDLETDGFDGPIVLASFATPKGAGAVPPDQLDRTLGRVGAPIASHNLKFDLKKVVESGCQLPRGLLLDTMVGAHLLDENGDLGLKPLAYRYLGRKLTEYENAENLEEYAIADAIAHRDLALHFWTELEAQGLLNLWLKVECTLVPIIAEMELRGIRMDRRLLEQRFSESDDRLDAARDRMRQILPDRFTLCQRDGCVGGTYNPKVGLPRPCVHCEGTGLNEKVWNSSQQMGAILFDHFGLTPSVYTEAGNPSTDKTALRRLRSEAKGEALEFLNRFQEFREQIKTEGFYKQYTEMITADDRIHADVWQTGTVTGRWSYSKPNMQQVPPEVRELFIPDEGKTFVSCDYTQIELYLLAELAGETNILEAYRNGEDLHERTASIVGADRSHGKTYNFGIVYGLSPKSLAGKLDCSVDRAKEIYREIYSIYDTLPEFTAETIREANQRGFVSTVLGRKRRLGALKSSDWAERNHAENQAVNARIQGSAADLIKAALINCKLKLPEAEPMLQIHDEILFQVPTEHAEDLRQEIQKCFETAMPRFTPRADAKLMNRWRKD